MTAATAETAMNDPVQPIRPAATVILVREARPQFEILMLRRTARAAFAGGMYVFPGGQVDSDDHLQVYAGLSRGPDQHQAAQVRAIGHEFLGYWVAVVRECFEEAGILLAYDAAGALVTAATPGLGELRQRLNAGDLLLDEVCRTAEVTLALDRIHFHRRVVTPAGRPRRFDTRFFIAHAPADQAHSHDDVETVDSIWVSPREALRLHREGDFGLMRVTERELQTLADQPSAAAVVNSAIARDQFVTERPELPPGERRGRQPGARS